MIFARLLLSAGFLFAATSSSGFESDVHYGLTQWLALQAGFDEEAANDHRGRRSARRFGRHAIRGPRACLRMRRQGRAQIQAGRGTSLSVRRHGSRRAADAGRRPDGDAAKKAALAVIKIPAGQANYMLFKLGEALHILQDSWSHQGVPGIPQPAEGVFTCDSTRAWGHPAARGGWNSHKADLTTYWRADTVAMAKATYHIDAIPDAVRDQANPRATGTIFVRCWTDSSRRRPRPKRNAGSFPTASATYRSWRGSASGTGAQSFELKWNGRKLPPLATPQSRQHAVDADLLDFFNRFFRAVGLDR